MFHSKTIAILAAIAATGSSLLLASGPAHAGAGRTTTVMTAEDGRRFQIVRFGDLDLRTDAGNSALHSRLRASARRVCAQSETGPRIAPADQQECMRTALNRALSSIRG